MKRTGLIERYRDFLKIPKGARIISLNEGSTPLIQAPVLAGCPRWRATMRCG